MSELQTLESIIEGKPNGATHFQDCDGYCYFQSDNYGMTDLYNNEPVKYENIVNIRSLADIQKQIDHLKEIAKLKTLIGDVVNSRSGDIGTVDGSFATVGVDELIHLESYFQGNG